MAWPSGRLFKRALAALACCGPGPWGPQRALLRLARPGPLPVPRPLRGHRWCAAWPRGPSAWSLGLSRRPCVARPRPVRSASGLSGAPGRPSPGCGRPPGRLRAPLASGRFALPRPAGRSACGLRSALRAAAGFLWSPLGCCGRPLARLRRPRVPLAFALRAGAGAPSGLLPPGGCAPWRAPLPPAPGRGGFAACGRRRGFPVSWVMKNCGATCG